MKINRKCVYFFKYPYHFAYKLKIVKPQIFSEERISKRKLTLKQDNIFLWHMWKRSIATLWLLTIPHFASWEKSHSPRISKSASGRWKFVCRFFYAWFHLTFNTATRGRESGYKPYSLWQPFLEDACHFNIHVKRQSQGTII